MKLLYISNPFFADCDFPLIKALQEADVDVTYLIMLAPFSMKSTLFNIKNICHKSGIISPREYEELKKYETYFDLDKVVIANRDNSKVASFSNLKMTMALYKFVKKGNFDIIHTDILIGKSMGFLYHLSPCFIQTVHDPFPHSGEDTIRRRSAYEYSFKRSSHFVILNKKQLDQFSTYYSIPKDKIHVNRLGVYDNIRIFVDERWKEKSNNILFFGRISPYKGIEYLCEAMKIVHNVIPDATLTIAGGGKMYFDTTEYEKLTYIDIQNHYIEMDELAEYICKCKLCVCPYTDATQSGVVMTAFSLYKPVVSTDVGALSETIIHGENGILVPPKDPQSLADGIIKILQDNDLYNKMKANIRNEYFDGAHGWQSIAKEYFSFYKSIIKK